MTTKPLFILSALFSSAPILCGQATFTDDFTKMHDYVSEGVAGTIWDGVYLGANEIAQPMGTGMAEGKTSVAQASNGILTVTSLQTDWESSADDGFFLFKIVNGDFDMSVQIAGPIDTRAHNFPGLMVRAFGPGGAPAPDGKENYFIWGRFDEYNIPNMLKNETAGVKRDRGLGTYPNSNYWLRVQRTGISFQFFEKAFATNDWNQVGTITRTNMDRPLQVGIEHADYDGGRVLSARYRNFSLTASAWGPFPSEPAPAAGLKIESGSANPTTEPQQVISWTPGTGSTGSLVIAWRGNPVLKEVPSDGIVYVADASPSTNSDQSRLPTEDYFVIYAGSGNKVTTSLASPTPIHAAVFSYVGEGKKITYSHTPARCEP